MDRNLILALVLTALILIGWDQLVLGPQREAAEAQQRQQGIEAAQQAGPSLTEALNAPATDATLDRIEALKLAPGRVPIETPAVTGSINLRGGVFDDLTLRRYGIEAVGEAPRVTLLSPRQTEGAQYVLPGMAVAGAPGDKALWEAPEGATLTPGTPLTLTRREGGVEHRLTYAVADDYLFTATYSISNESGAPITVEPYTTVLHRDLPDTSRGIAFEGPIAVAGGTLQEQKYKSVVKKGGFEVSGTGGWTGLASKYWLVATAPPQDQPFTAQVRSLTTAPFPQIAAATRLAPTVLQPGEATEVQNYVYTGPKRVRLLNAYEDAYGITEFDKAIDWGFLFFLTRPIFAGLQFFAGLFGNWGVAILALTLVIKAILFPLANASYKSMANMRKLTPEVSALRERYKDDPTKMQQEMMALYKKNKVNPAAGCLPILAQMPIFFSLYKVLFTTIELRHQPFLYIKDLSEQDPTTVFNLFGLLPYDPSVVPVVGAFLGIGILPLLMGVAMWVQTKLNPPPPDPMQAKIFGLMPFIFVFIFAPFAAGLVLYWFWNTTLGVIQQYVIMSRAGAKPDILGNVKNAFGRGKAANSNTPAE
ncbi:membrane protein insertase YidC [Parvularcula dongshanensis]|uniref:Membrane protein insertase YidC n=1 Tax=Parvularcula dongshanensis TaxID=1173995 RepID=A0A840I706_9PROT|nr:membrane protein insertase YidC [Parvularcula dongshanensis]MBB4660105.1 YidC/Oxa1 family membrane protein insertase [Parvularcula dongshanensis]